MPRPSHLPAARLTILAFGLILALSACSGKHNSDLDKLDTSDTLTSLSASEAKVLVYPETWLAGGKGKLVLSEHSSDTDYSIEISVNGAQDLRGLFCRLEFDPQRLSPGQLKGAGVLADDSQSLRLDLQGQGVVEFAALTVAGGNDTGQKPAALINGDQVLATLSFKRQAQPGVKAISAVPDNDASKTLLSFNSDTSNLDWGYYSQGDYNQDGQVLASDLAPIGIHFQENVPTGSDPDGRDNSSIQDVIDGSNDGKVNVADLTAIGLNFQHKVAAYKVYRGAAADYPASNSGPNGPGTELLGIVGFGERQGDPGQSRLSFSFSVGAVQAGNLYWVRPLDAVDAGNEGSPSFSLDGGNVNIKPIAFLFPTVGFSGGIPVTVDFPVVNGSDADGTVVKWEFDPQGDGEFEFVWTEEPGPQSFTYEEYGYYHPTLRVTDDDGATGISVKSINVQDPDDDAPVAVIESDFSAGNVPLTVHFDGSASTDADGSITSYQWTIDGILFPASSNPEISYEFKFGGTRFVQLEVLDDKGAPGFKNAEIDLTDPTNLAPIASFTTETPSGPAPFLAHFDASASLDTDGVIKVYQWDIEGDGTFDFITKTPLMDYTFTTKETRSVKLRVVDDDKAESNTASQDVEITSGWVLSLIGEFPPIDDVSLLVVPDVEVFENVLVGYTAYNGLNTSTYVACSDANAQSFSLSLSVVNESMQQLDLLLTDGLPALAFGIPGIPGVGGYGYQRSQVKNFLTTFPPVQISGLGEDDTQYGMDMELIDGKPMILSIDNTSALRCSRSGDANGGAWFNSRLVAGLSDPAGPVESPQLLDAGGKPAAVCQGASGQVFYMRSTDNFFSDIESLQTPITDIVPHSASAALIDGVPAIAYSSAADYSLLLVKATDAAGSSWGTPTVVYAPANATPVYHTVLRNIDGKPAVACENYFQGIDVIRATDAGGTQWDAPLSVTNYSAHRGALDLVDFQGQPGVAFVSEIAGDQTLRFAIWTE